MRARIAASALFVALFLGVAATASAGQRPAADELQLEPAVGSLTSSWGVTSTVGLKGFRVRWRALTTPTGGWGKSVDLSSRARSYTIAGLQPATYEVLVRSIVGTRSCWSPAATTAAWSPPTG